MKDYRKRRLTISINEETKKMLGELTNNISAWVREMTLTEYRKCIEDSKSDALWDSCSESEGVSK